MLYLFRNVSSGGGRGQGEREPGGKGVGALREVGEERAGNRNSEGGGNREKLGKFCKITLYSAVDIAQRGGNHKERGGNQK